MNKERNIITNSITNINILLHYGVCFNCENYIDIPDNRVPKYFCCQKLYDLLDFPMSINEICLNWDDEKMPYCFSFIPKTLNKHSSE